MYVYFLTTVHPREDVRVFHNELLTLNSVENNKCTFIVSDGKGPSNDRGINILDMGGANLNRIFRIFFGAVKSIVTLMKLPRGVVHIHDPELLLAAPFIKLVGFKVFYDVHEDLPRQIYSKYWVPQLLKGPLSKIVSFVETSSSFYVSHYICATRQIAERFPKQKTTIIRNFPTATLVSEKERNFGNKIAYLGSITEARGLLVMLDVIQNLNENGSNVTLKLGGKFSPESLYDEAIKHPAWKFTEYVGWINRADITSFFEGCFCGLVLLKPYTNYLESSPNKLFEYMAMGLPVIASDFPVWRGLISPKDGVIFSSPENITEISEKICYLLRGSNTCEVLGKNGKSAILREFNWEVESEKLKGLYRIYE